ncbi:MAG: hypothetical protein OXT65_07450 [Alphaproteobacteria bacterium]|nr:hypothetical protein [Alphaproteobacteria bacterium]
MRYFISPELHRNLWQKFSTLHLVSVPFVLAMLCFIASKTDVDNPETAINGLMTVIFYLVFYVWGIYEAGTAVQDEVKSRTWDLQRMSAMSPCHLAFGKFFGVVSYTWYAGLATLAIFAYTFPLRGFSGWKSSTGATLEQTAYIVFFMFMIGVVGQGVAFLLSFADLSAAIKEKKKSRLPKANLPLLVGLFTSFTLHQFVMEGLLRGRLGTEGLYRYNKLVTWFSAEYMREDFMVFTLLFFALLIFYGIYRMMRIELMYPVWPVGWTLTALLIAGYSIGFMTVKSPTEQIVAAFMVYLMMLVAAYGAMIKEADDWQKLGRFAARIRGRNWRGALQGAPSWVTAAAASLACMAVMSWLAWHAHRTESDDKALHAIVLSATMFLFAVRDGIVMHLIFRLSAKTARFGFVLYYLVIYGLLPTVHMLLLNSVFSASDLANAVEKYLRKGTFGDKIDKITDVMSWYYPSLSLDVGVFVPVLVQIALLALWWRNVLVKGRVGHGA